MFGHKGLGSLRVWCSVWVLIFLQTIMETRPPPLGRTVVFMGSHLGLPLSLGQECKPLPRNPKVKAKGTEAFPAPDSLVG